MSGMRRVIVGVSGSAGSVRALRYAAQLACDADAPVIAVLAWVPPGGDLAERRAPSPELRRIWRRAAAERLDAAMQAAWGGMPAGLTVQPTVARGPAGPVLVQVADLADDLLVIGAGRRGALARLWRGQVSRYCLAHAKCAVLAVPPADQVLRAAHGLGGWSFRRRELTADQVLHELSMLDQGGRQS